MLKLILYLSFSGTTIITTTPNGSFDYLEYDNYAHVVEGEFITESADSVYLRVTEVWTGSSETGDELTLFIWSSTFLEQGEKALFIADSTGMLQCLGHAREGFYILIGNTSPNILTVDDLELLSRGDEPEFNKHESQITVRFPLSSEVIDITVAPTENGRRIISNYLPWNDLDPFGNICSGYTDMTELGMIPSEDDLYQGVQLGIFAGDVRKYSGGTYFIDLWPKYPCFASIQNMDNFHEYGSIPVYMFRIEMENEDYWSIGLPDEAIMVSAGRDFYLRGRQRWASEDTRRYLENFDLFFRTFASGGSGYSSRGTILRIDDMDRELNRPLLATMLEVLKDRPISGTLYFVESDDSEPELYSDCTISLYTPTFEIAATCDTTTMDALINDVTLSINDTGSAILEYDGRTFPQIHMNLGFPWSGVHPPIRQYTYAVFDYPGDGDYYLLLHFSSVRQSTYIDGADDMLISALIHYWIKDGIIEGKIYKLDRISFETEHIGTFSMSKI